MMLASRDLHKRNDASAALVIGFTIQGLAIARALRSKGVKVYALSRGDPSKSPLLRHPVFYSNSAQYLFAEDLMGGGLIETLLSIRKSISESRVVLYPANDLTVLTLADNWPTLDGHYSLSWSKCRHSIKEIVHKANLPAYCDSANVDYPKTYVIRKESDIPCSIKGLTYPILLKPDKQASTFKTYLCNTADELVSFVNLHTDSWPLIAQEWISGSDRSLYFYTCFAEEGREHYGFTGRKVRASPPGVGIATIIETESAPGVRVAGQKLLQVMGITGPVAMEFKKDDYGRYWFIEANVGRTEFCVDLGIQAGFNLPYVEFSYATQVPLPAANDWVECMWFDTDKEPFCYAHLCLKERTFRPHGKEPVFPYHGKECWQVRAAALLEATRKLWKRMRQKLS